jgi:molybdate transport system ATP-binding protein
LSNGETKRLLLAAALIKNPLILLLDNPLTGLDVNARKEFDHLISEIASSGISIIMATSPAEIPDVITDIAVLENGRIRTVAKEEFDPLNLSQESYSVSDVKELDRLLSISKIADYEFIVKMEEVSIKYGDKTILDHINWELKQGERWALTGANGAGKSTLLSLINGDNPQAFANKIILFDRPKGTGESIWDIKKKTGFVSPELFQYFPMDNTCLQVIESGFYNTLGLFRRSSASKSELCLRWMHLLGIEKYAAVLIKKVPVSVQRLCLLARALVSNPPLLIFDEPCQGLDEEQQQRFRNIVDEICERTKASLIYVSHYEQEMPTCINRRLHLVNGRVV